MTIRIIAQIQDFNAGANVIGAHACTTLRTFDIELPELESFLNTGGNTLAHAQIIGGFVMEEKP